MSSAERVVREEYAGSWFNKGHITLEHRTYRPAPLMRIENSVYVASSDQ